MGAGNGKEPWTKRDTVSWPCENRGSERCAYQRIAWRGSSSMVQLPTQHSLFAITNATTEYAAIRATYDWELTKTIWTTW